MTRLVACAASALFALTAGVATTPARLPGQPPEPGYDWPLRPAPDRIVADFDPPAEPWLPGNRGLDLAGAPGEPVRSANTGLVTFAGPVGGTGAVAVTFGALRTTYEPVTPSVHRGELVHTGQIIGHLDTAVLHWGLLRGTDYLDPLALLGLERVRLLPVPALSPWARRACRAAAAPPWCASGRSGSP